MMIMTVANILEQTQNFSEFELNELIKGLEKQVSNQQLKAFAKRWEGQTIEMNLRSDLPDPTDFLDQVVAIEEPPYPTGMSLEETLIAFHNRHTTRALGESLPK
jgi:hypothetical protein